jgi:antitoxin component of RelBE/YafQ-DinJ toxin-antitoxin module
MSNLTKNDKTTINVKIPKKVKKELDNFTSAVGIPLSTMINSFLLDLAKTRKFVIEQELELPENLAKELRKSLAEVKRGVYVSTTLDNLEKSLNSKQF